MRSLLIKEGLSMPVLSIVACEMLEDELVYALSKDPEIKRLFVIENRNSFRFVKKLKSEHLKPFVFSPEKLYPLISEINRKSFGNPMGKLSNFPLFKKTYDVIFNKKQQKLTVVVNLLRKDLHSDIDLLQSEVYLNAKEMSKISNGVLLFYGKCGFSSEKNASRIAKTWLSYLFSEG
ncbi:DUF1638 domain-containing protein [Methanosarcina horonobensis]|uniref:DUF1638 domain-containing protein n=1 Tax=Methanosarcina horonobensis TaxID=418008 RepID=UPI0022B8BCB5|nr:DUF1638 domain-containing protein [Methanosarcina horonobensis]